MSKSNKELCIEIINALPDERLARVVTLLKSIKYMSDEIYNDEKILNVPDLEVNGVLDNLADKLGIK